MICSQLSDSAFYESLKEKGKIFCTRVHSVIIERLRFTFTPNGKREFVPRDQVFPLIFRLLFIASTQK